MAGMTSNELRSLLLTLQTDDRVLLSGFETDETGALTFRCVVRPRPDRGPKITEHGCRWCAKPFTARSTAKYCSTNCRSKAHRASKLG